jgi:hypothetical protein
MLEVNFKKNIEALKMDYHFTDKDFLEHFGLREDQLLQTDIQGTSPILVDKSIDLTYAYKHISADERLTHLIDVLSQVAHFSMKTIAAYGHISEDELKAYIEEPSSLDSEKKFVCCAYLSLLERTITENHPII